MIRYPMPRREALVGASATNDIVVPFPGVSRVHARAVPTPNGVTISDCGSKNGIRHAGQRIEEFELVQGEALQIGRAELRIEEHSTSDVIALPLAARDTTQQSAETQSDEEEAGTGAVAAMACARALAGTTETALARPSNPILTRCRRAVGASAIVLFDAREGEPTIFLCDGEVPNAEVLQLLHRRAVGREPFVTSIGDISAIVCRVDRRCLAVIGNVDGWETWQREFAGVLAVRLGRHSQRRPTEQTATQGALVIPPGMIVGESPAIHSLLEQMRMTLRSQLDVLLLGETGTGKELFARLIHASSPNSDGPFVAINCAAIPGELLESQLFGMQGRVATGVDPYPGLFILANGGTILLDEIGELAEPLQAKLLRVLQEREVLPLGARVPTKVSLRVISASNRDLQERVREGKFRADLYYRLRGLQFHIPPLRHRRDDIP
ncbi:MAG TPA: sigma 54-interacting transcriptional regulator, partial [Thermoanaerobaculia bacterium]